MDPAPEALCGHRVGRRELPGVSAAGGSRDPKGPRVAVVLGSGSVKCAAALGLLRVLQREGIGIDMIVGCSGGSLSKTESMVEAMADGDAKIAAQKEVSLAQDSMLAGKMSACAEHLGKAMHAGGAR